ncbi:MAG: metalloregulator ArsR/SmtB family transcription factor [Gammaproteobacteria bacterium]|nr:metalloregulator ArsR/SmtB family transcription factor [Gammaproteobacteria bacterium]
MNIDTNTLFSALSNEIRLRCLMLLQLQGELCVCELTHALDLSQPMISRHLALLRNNGLVSDRRAGQWIYYRINPDLEQWALSILATAARANCDKAPFCDDLSVLEEMPNRPGTSCCA